MKDLIGCVVAGFLGAVGGVFVVTCILKPLKGEPIVVEVEKPVVVEKEVIVEKIITVEVESDWEEQADRWHTEAEYWFQETQYWYERYEGLVVALDNARNIGDKEQDERDQLAKELNAAMRMGESTIVEED